MIEETIQELKDGITKAHEALRRELGRLRTGRANPGMLDSIRVEYYGAQTPLNQMASVSVPEPRLIIIKPFDKTTIGQIEKAIMMSPVDLNPQNDGEVIRIPVPALTEERRKDLVKVARGHGETCKIAIRAARHEARDMMDAFKKDGDFGEDEVDRALKKLEGVVQEGNSATDEIIAKKEKDILEI